MSNTPQLAPSGPVILEGKHDGIATLVMNRPDRLNALNSELATALNEALGRTMPQPVIAAVNGPAAGAGMNVALAADIRIAAEEATFGQNFAKVGLYPDYGGTYFLPQLVGPSKAAELFYTGDMIDAKMALALGIVNQVVPAAQLEAAVKTLAQKIAQGPSLPIRAVKKALFASEAKELAQALDYEVREQIRCFMSEDCSEGIRAFFDKRPPKFQGQ